MQVMSCFLLFGALYEESRYMKSVVAISLARIEICVVRTHVGIYCIQKILAAMTDQL